MTGKRYVYTIAEAGHRASWIKLFSGISGYEPLIGPPSAQLAKQMIAADEVLYTTLEDALGFFARVALGRALRGKRTRVLMMNPGRALHGGRITHAIKYVYLRFFKMFPGVDSLSIIPFYIDPRLARLSTGWFYDPQFWDLTPGELVPQSCPLSEEIAAKAAGRKILLFLGRMDVSKGSRFFVECLRAHPDLAETHFFVAAGKAADQMKPLGADLETLGGLHIDRYLTDEEVICLKHGCDTLWACYDPYYNSSSGLFGRALQLGKDVLIREPSYLDVMATELGFPAGRVAYGDTEAVKAYLQAGPAAPFDGLAAHRYCRDFSLERIDAFLGQPGRGALEAAE